MITLTTLLTIYLIYCVYQAIIKYKKDKFEFGEYSISQILGGFTICVIIILLTTECVYLIAKYLP